MREMHIYHNWTMPGPPTITGAHQRAKTLSCVNHEKSVCVFWLLFWQVLGFQAQLWQHCYTKCRAKELWLRGNRGRALADVSKMLVWEMPGYLFESPRCECKCAAPNQFICNPRLKRLDFFRPSMTLMILISRAGATHSQLQTPARGTFWERQWC